jgi:hypothetical protein
MENENVITCGGLCLKTADKDGARHLALTLWGSKDDSNVRLQIADIHKPLMRDVPPVFQDLLEIAAYVYCADQALTRGGLDVDTLGSHWRRLLHFHIPVRCPDVWRSAEILRALTSLLEFLSDDVFEFTFHPAHGAPPFQQYLELTDEASTSNRPSQVVMYSGGLDSLAGAVQESVIEKNRIVLVNHRPTPKLNNRLRDLEQLLSSKAGPFAPAHIPVRINKSSNLNRDYTQRTRSFLYVCLGATVARMLGLSSVRFYENGVVSLNLPTCPQVIGARATRTTHPRVLQGFQELITMIAGEPFTVENPFIWKTKGDLIEHLIKANCGDLIGPSTSCAHTWTSTKEHSHCGTCSQCIDRRIAIVAANAESLDPIEQYAKNVFTDSFPKREDKTMLATYVARASSVGNLHDISDLFDEFPDVARCLRYFRLDVTGAADRVFELYKKHAHEVRRAIKTMLARHVDEIFNRTLPGDCLLRIVYESGSVICAPAVSSPPAAVATNDNGPRYCLRQHRRNWEIVFNGERTSIGNEKGLSIVEYLLKNPSDEPIHVCDIEAEVCEVNANTNGILEIEDPETGKKITLGRNARLQERNLSIDDKDGNQQLWLIRKKYAAVEDDPKANDMERQEARQAIDQIDEYLNKPVAARASNATKAYDRVRQAITRLMKSLTSYRDNKGNKDRVYLAFANHLQKHLIEPSARYSGTRSSRTRAQVAQTFTYEPPAGVTWSD